jgi:hypothetical protein
MRKLSRQAGWWTRGSLVGGGVLIAAGLLLAWRFGERASPKVLQEVRAAPAQEDDPFGGPRFPVELEPTPAFIASMRRQAWILGAVMALAVGMLVVAFVIMRPTAPVTIAQAGLMLLSGAGLTWMFAREIVQPARLRITATHVALFRDGRCVVEVPLADVYATERMLLLGTKRVIYRLADPQRGKIPPTYDLEALRSALLSRLPESHLVDDATFNKHAIGRQPLWIKASALGVLLVIVLFMLREVAAI